MTPALLRGEHVVLQRTRPEDAEGLRALLAAPEVAAWWGAVPPGFPTEEGHSELTRWSILSDDRVAGMIQVAEESEPDYRNASVDLFIDPALHSRGLGSDALSTICRHLFEERRHHRITIDPATTNHAAIRCYEKAGFRPVGVMHAAWRDPGFVWRDVLLMELVQRPTDRRRPPVL